MVSLFPALFVFFIDINSQFDNLKSSLAMGGSLWIISMGQIESERWVTLNWTSGSFSIGTVGQLRRIKHLTLPHPVKQPGEKLNVWKPFICKLFSSLFLNP
jgi:hypothetical protein